MKGLSLTQPYASLVAIGAKRIETRSWSTSYRGPIAIHAAKAFPPWARDVLLDEPFRTALIGGYGQDFRLYPQQTLPLGAIVAVGELVDCIPTERIGWDDRPPFYVWTEGDYYSSPMEQHFGDYSPGRFAWVLRDVRRLPEPIPCRGAPGLWDVPLDICSRIQEAIR